jgi:PAS domain-containing protein
VIVVQVCFVANRPGYGNIVPNANMLTHGFSPELPEPLTVSQGDQDAAPVLQDPAVICFDVEGRCSSCDAAFLQLIGYSQQEIIRREFCALFAIAETAAAVISWGGPCWKRSDPRAATAPTDSP